MTIKEQFTDALSRPMSRKAFLGQVGALLLAVVGVSAVLKSLRATGNHTDARSPQRLQEGSGNYGGQAYGG